MHLKDVTINAKTKGQGIIFGPGNSQNVYERLTVEDNDREGILLPAGTYKQCYFKAGEITINSIGNYVLDNASLKMKNIY